MSEPTKDVQHKEWCRHFHRMECNCGAAPVAEARDYEQLTPGEAVLAAAKIGETSRRDALAGGQALSDLLRAERNKVHAYYFARDQAAQERRDKWWESQCIIEIATRNPSVADYCKHWEGRAESAERRERELREAITKDNRCRLCGDQVYANLGDKELTHRVDCVLRRQLDQK